MVDKAMFLNPGAFIANSVGGLNGAANARLQKFDWVSIRTHTEGHTWTPDSVFALRTLFHERLKTAPLSVQYVQRLFSETGYVAVQLKHKYLRKLSKASEVFRATQAAAGAPVVLFRAGAAEGHDSLTAYDEARLPRSHVFEDLDAWSIVSLISRAKLVVTTSLHVQIIAASWGVPRLQLSFTSKLDKNMAEFESEELRREGYGLIHPKFCNANGTCVKSVERAVTWLLSSAANSHVSNTSVPTAMGHLVEKNVRIWRPMLF